MKISWGWKIAGLYIGFVLMMSFLVFKSVHQHYDLTDKDYYTEEIKYQQVIDAGKNQSQLTAPVSVGTNGQQVYFNFPAEFKNKTIAGNIHFYAPANAAWDAHFTINTSDGAYAIPADRLHKIRYEIKISWQTDNKQYYQESAINLSHQ